MEEKEFQYLILETMICATACDGEIDEREIAVLRQIVQHSQYFQRQDISQILNDRLQAVQNDGRAFLNSYLKALGATQWHYAQELQIMEVILRIMHADERIDDNEVEFFKLVRSKLKVHDEIIHQRFGDIPFLPGSRMPVFNPSRLDQRVAVEAIAKKMSHIEPEHLVVEASPSGLEFESIVPLSAGERSDILSDS
jgi:uncharacterized tellurite resistance protein B-like protein